jgi:transglutaminase-like putative cysteine protease
VSAEPFRALEQHWVRFADREAKLDFMRASVPRDMQHPLVKRVARRFERLPRPAREEAILAFCQFGITYASDPRFTDSRGRHPVEVLDSVAVALDRGFGDCDVKALAFVTLCRLCGIEADLDPVFRGETGFPHVRAKVRGLDGRWRVADPSIVNSSIGRLPKPGTIVTHLPY